MNHTRTPSIVNLAEFTPCSFYSLSAQGYAATRYERLHIRNKRVPLKSALDNIKSQGFNSSADVWVREEIGTD